MALPKLSTLTEAEINEAASRLVGWIKMINDKWYLKPYFDEAGIVDSPPDYLRDERAAITLCNWMAEKGNSVNHNLVMGVWVVTFGTHKAGPPSLSLATAITYTFCIANNLTEL